MEALKPVSAAKNLATRKEALARQRLEAAAGALELVLEEIAGGVTESLEAYRDKADYSDDEGPASVDVGDRVDAFWDRRPDRGWYAATVTSVGAARTCTVHYDDGDDASLPFRLIRKRVRAPDVEFAAGDRVHADWKGNGKYSGATVKRRLRGGAYDLDFDDGYSEPGVHADRVWP